MSQFENNQVRETFQAAADLSAKRYHFVRLTGTTAYTNQSSNPSGSDNIGVLQNEPASGEAAQVAVQGMTRLVCGSSVAIGGQLTTSASGRAVTVSSGGYVMAKALEAASADGDIITALIQDPWKFAG